MSDREKCPEGCWIIPPLADRERENKTIRIFVCYYDILLSGLHRSAGVRKRRRGMMMVVKEEEEEDGKRPKERRRRKKRNVKLVEDIFFF
jgi:hypothetical protein